MNDVIRQVAQVCRVYPLERGGTHTRPDHGPRVATQAPRTRYTHTPREATSQVGPAAGPRPGVLHAGMMRVYLQAVPWVWLATAVSGVLTWHATADRAEDWASLACSSQGADLRVYKCVPQSSPSEGVVK